MKSFTCRGCLNPVTIAGCTSVDIGASAKLELVDKFCYLGDMLSVDGDAHAVVEARIRVGWNKFRQSISHSSSLRLSFLSLLTNTLPGPAPLKLRPYGAIQICLLLLLLTNKDYN